MSVSIQALALHATVTCSTFVEHDSFSRTKEMVKSLECQNVDQNQYFNFSSGYMACNARQGIVSNNSSCLLKKIVLFHCKTKIKYLLFIPISRPNLWTVCLEIDIDIVWRIVYVGVEISFLMPSICHFLSYDLCALAGFIKILNNSEEATCFEHTLLLQLLALDWLLSQQFRQRSVQWILHSNWTSIFDIWFDVSLVAIITLISQN